MTNLLNVLADCSGLGISDTNSLDQIANVVSIIITVLKVAVPVMVVIFGMLDLGKAVVASKEDEIKKGQQMFIRRVISAVLVFFVVVVVQLVVNVAAGDDSDNVWTCVKAFTCGVNENGQTNC